MQTSKRALITGITGQDGSHLAELLLQKGAQVNRPGWAPLHYAATGGSIPMVELLLEHHAFIESEGYASGAYLTWTDAALAQARRDLARYEALGQFVTRQRREEARQVRVGVDEEGVERVVYERRVVAYVFESELPPVREVGRGRQRGDDKQQHERRQQQACRRAPFRPAV